MIPRAHSKTRRSTGDRHDPARASEPAPRDAFTLLELLIVIGIIGLLTALIVPSLKNVRKSNALASASQQLIDDIAMARRLAIKDRTTVMMIFQPSVTAAEAGTFSALNTGEKNVLLRGQQTAYALYSFRQVGDQPGDPHPRYLRSWRNLPSGYFIPAWKFPTKGTSTFINATNSREGAVIEVKPFNWTTPNIPVPSLKSPPPRQVRVSRPYIAFGPTGGLQVQNNSGDFVNADSDEYLPLAHGSIFLARDPNDEKTLVWQPADIAENPPGNSTSEYQVIVIDKLTGRTRVAKPEINP